MKHEKTKELLTTILRDVSRSFYLTLRVLPSGVRTQIGLAYLLARTTDTIADTGLLPAEDRLSALQTLRDRISGKTREPLNLARLLEGQGSKGEQVLLHHLESVLDLLATFDDEDRAEISRVIQTISEGQEQDLLRFDKGTAAQILSLQTPEQLDNYTYLVAGCVGEFWTRMCRRHLFPKAPLDERQLLARGTRFGKGLQLVNILRDLPTDLRNGRCYIPQTQLESVGLKPADLLDSNRLAAFRPVYNSWLELANSHLLEGWSYTNSLPYSQMRVRLACAWPLLIGFETLTLLRSGNVLDAKSRLKVGRGKVRGLIWRSLAYYPFPRLWRSLAPAAQS